MPYPDNFNAYLYDKTIGSDGEGDAPPRVDEVNRLASKLVGNALAQWRNAHAVNFPGCKWDETVFDTVAMIQTLEEAMHDATKKGF